MRTDAADSFAPIMALARETASRNVAAAQSVAVPDEVMHYRAVIGLLPAGGRSHDAGLLEVLRKEAWPNARSAALEAAIPRKYRAEVVAATEADELEPRNIERHLKHIDGGLRSDATRLRPPPFYLTFDKGLTL